ncbi:MAG: TolC family protein [Gemmatimonadales bacterium]
MRFAWSWATAVAAAIAAVTPVLLTAQTRVGDVVTPIGPGPDSGIALGPRLSLETVIAQTARHSPAWASASGTVQTARSAERVALGAYLPSVALNAVAGRSDQSVTSNTVLATTQPGVAQSAYGAGVSASLDLFTGGRRSAVRHETAALSRAADAGLISQRFLTRLTAQQGFLEVLRGHELVRVADEGMAVADRSLSFAKARAEAGTATPSDVLRAELGLSQARRQWLAARDTLASGAAALGRLVGADGPADAEPLTNLNPTGLALDDSAVVRTAVHDAPSVQQAQALLTAAHATVTAAKSQYAPTIQAGAGYNWSNDGRVPGALNQGWVIQVGTSFPLFNGFIREDAVTQANVTAEVASSSSQDTRRFSRAEALRLLGSLHVAEQDVVLTTEAVQLAMEDLRVISVRYRGGIATILDQLTSQQNLIQAELDLVSARFTYQVTRATLEALLGREL